MTMQEALRAYLKLQKTTEDIPSELRYLASEAFKEGWIQCERALKEK